MAAAVTEDLVISASTASYTIWRVQSDVGPGGLAGPEDGPPGGRGPYNPWELGALGNLPVKDRPYRPYLPSFL
jgi:hypothetical protein